MGCCNSKAIYNDSYNDNPIKITLLGLPNTGKTSIVEFIAGEYDPKLRPIETQGVVAKNIINKGERIIVYDCGGLRDREDDWHESIEKSNAVIYVLDPLSINHCYIFLHDLFNITAGDVNKKNIPILFIMTKTRNSKYINKLNLLRKEFFRDKNVKIAFHPNLTPEINDTFLWLINEVRLNFY